mgnify:FL=1|tara:strand:- start:1274 stop:1429 length:156 start_codon:yes stop_codon:yes gene_type:complete
MKITVKNGDKEIQYEERQEVTSYLKITNKDYNKLILDTIKLMTEQVVELSK